jgi:hypothetical protein
MLHLEALAITLTKSETEKEIIFTTLITKKINCKGKSNIFKSNFMTNNSDEQNFQKEIHFSILMQLI